MLQRATAPGRAGRAMEGRDPRWEAGAQSGSGASRIDAGAPRPGIAAALRGAGTGGLLSGVALGAFLCWFNLVFRVVLGPAYSPGIPLLSASRTDSSWIAASLSSVACCAVMLLACRVGGHRANVAGNRAGAAGNRSSAAVGHPHAVEACATALALVGGALILVPGGGIGTQVAGGVACGLAIPPLIVQLVGALTLPLPLPTVALVAFGILVSGAFDLLACVLVHPVSLALIGAMPAVGQALLVVARRTGRRGGAGEPARTRRVCPAAEATGAGGGAGGGAETDGAAGGQGQVNWLERYRLATACLVFFGSSLVIGFSGFSMDVGSPEGAPLSQWPLVMGLAALVSAAVLGAIVRFDALDLLQVSVALALATSALLLPLSGGGALALLAVTLDRVSIMCTYALFALQVHDVARGGEPWRPEVVRVVARLVLTYFACMLAGVVAGAVVYGRFGNDATALAVMALFTLYFVFLVIVVAMRRGRRVEHVLVGESIREEDVARIRARELSERHPDLSPREVEVLGLMLRNYSNARIARELGVSDNTVKTHVRHVFAKLGINSRDQLMTLAESIPVLQGRGRPREDA
ncbi:MAG: helix-turn-helix transcriptional regulator [Coriobacteriales bacterium]|jgi:DNA-binding CsgD family transcriptional regulator